MTTAEFEHTLVILGGHEISVVVRRETGPTVRFDAHTNDGQVHAYAGYLDIDETQDLIKILLDAVDKAIQLFSHRDPRYVLLTTAGFVPSDEVGWTEQVGLDKDEVLALAEGLLAAADHMEDPA